MWRTTPFYTEGPSESKVLLDTLRPYLGSGGRTENCELYWYFRPWISGKKRPKESGVFAIHKWAGYAGFAYFDAPTATWLMTSSTVSCALKTAESYHHELLKDNGVGALAYVSNYQKEKSWSSANLAGIDELPAWGIQNKQLMMNKEAFELCTLRMGVDPKLRKKQPWAQS